MAIEALRQSRDQNSVSREEAENSLNPANRVSTEQGIEQDNSREDRAGNEQAGEEMELDFGS